MFTICLLSVYHLLSVGLLSPSVCLLIAFSSTLVFAQHFLVFFWYSMHASSYEDKRFYIYLLHMYSKMVSVSLHTSYTFASCQDMIAKGMQAHCLYTGRSQHMHEEFGTVLHRGFKTWVRNLNICIPYMLNSFISLILYLLFFAIMGLLFFTSSTGTIIDPATLSDEEIFAMMWEGFSKNLGLSVSLLLAVFLFAALTQSYFTAGAIGMAKKASETGDTRIADMLDSGSKNIFRLFLTVLLTSLILLVGIIFLVPGALAVGNLSALVENPEASIHGMTALVIGVILWTVYIIIVNLVLSLSSYALVIDELGPLEALSTSVIFFINNKLDVFFMWVFTIGLVLINNYVGELAGPGNGMIAAVTLFIPPAILQPLTAVLWTRLYMTRRGKKLYDPSELLLDPDSF
ncbi:hypothetical protein SAMN02910340_01355 [Methanosarcina thermophila]|jgi:hypothetical protein|uniref:DUF7847 domain-containing protein n=5 Tax=Methanosarcina thermophila TaxID=2210 RepID=A0A1I6Z7P9_METTE|nr:hypothetical protein SAMN02910340_01355 [Methanosarcina thermophila]